MFIRGSKLLGLHLDLAILCKSSDWPEQVTQIIGRNIQE